MSPVIQTPPRRAETVSAFLYGRIKYLPYFQIYRSQIAFLRMRVAS